MTRSQTGGVWWRALFVAALIALVAFGVWWVDRPDWEAQDVSEIDSDPESRTIEVTLHHSRCEHGPRVRVISQESSEVVLRAEHDAGGDCDSIALTSTLEVELDAPLGDREIRVDESN